MKVRNDPSTAIAVMARRALDDVTINSPSLNPEKVQNALILALGFWLPVRYVERRLKANPMNKRCSTGRKVGFHSLFRHWRFRYMELPKYLAYFRDDPSDGGAQRT